MSIKEGHRDSHRYCHCQYISSRKSPSRNFLSLMFNGHLFSYLSGVLDYIQDYTVGKKRINVFFKIINQDSSIMQLSLAFAKSLVVAIQKDPS